MLKKVLVTAFLLTLITVAIVQAMGNSNTNVEGKGKTGITIGAKAPDFELETLTGDTIRLSDFQGQKVILNFWATWCPPCREEMPAMQKYFEETDENVVILAVNMDSNNDVQSFIDNNKLTFTIPLDVKNSVSSTYQISSIPTTYFIDSSGVINHKLVGEMKIKDMEMNVAPMK